MSKGKKKLEKPKEVKEERRSTSKSKSNRSSVLYLIALIVSIKVGIIAYGFYFIYYHETAVPDVPQMDLNAWWGPNETKATQDTSIRPFRVVFSDGMLHDLRSRFEDYRSDAKRKKSLKDTAWTYGVHSEGFGQIFAHWIFKYNFKEREKYLNQFDHFKTNIQGLDIHFLHVKPKVDKNVEVVPLLLLHGWPGSIREFYDAIPLLTTPRSGQNFVFEVIAPSLPGVIYSQAAVRPGLGPPQIAVIMRNLMKRLGIARYYIQGGDFGHAIASEICTLFPSDVLGFHTNTPLSFDKKAIVTWVLGSIWPTLVEPKYSDRMYPLKDKVEFLIEETGYHHIQSTKPDTIGVALQDSPPGLAAYILDRIMIFTDPNNKFEEDGGLSKYYDFTSLLDNIMLYWSTNSITTSMRLYKEAIANSELMSVLARIPVSAPTWALRFKHDLVFQPEFILRWKFPNLLGTTTHEYGGHYAAFEKPKEFADDVFKAVKRFREYYTNK